MKDSGNRAGFLFVNNFSGDEQLESSDQPDWMEVDSTEYDVFVPHIKEGLLSNTPLGFLDNRYANGGDGGFVIFMEQQTIGPHGGALRQQAYAGWNTNGNTVGTVVANTVLLGLFSDVNGSTQSRTGIANAAFNSLRILEDMHYQADLRQVLVSYVDEITNTDESTSYLTPDLDFYERYVFKMLSSRYDGIRSSYDLPWNLQSSYYPWNRTFEIGLTL